MEGINNTTIIEKTRKYGKIIEWEAKHQCIGDVCTNITDKDIEGGVPILCLLCGRDIVIFK